MKAEDGEDEAKGPKKGKKDKKATAKAKAKAKGKAKVKASPKTKPKVAKVVTPGQNNEEVEPRDAKGKGKGKGKRQQRADEESHKGNGKGRGKSKKVKTGKEDDPDNTRGGNELGQDLSGNKDAEDRKREQEQQEKIKVPKDGKRREPTKTEPKDSKQKKQPPKNSQATPEEKGNGGPATFARRKCPETSYGKAKWEALKSVFLDIIKPKLQHYSAHEVGVDL